MNSNADCKEAGLLSPVIDRNRCEGKEDCVRVCPYDVFEIVRLDQTQRAELSVVGRVKGFVHGYRQASAVRAEQCHACGLCVKACPEKAITLARSTQTRSG
jgi:NAD-dependent dihydropyrimidine dehydrogenase PreA subunit